MTDSELTKRKPSIIFSDVGETVVNIRRKLARLFYTTLLSSRTEHLFNTQLLQLYQTSEVQFNEAIDVSKNYYIEREILTPKGVEYYNSVYNNIGLHLFDTAQDNGFYDDLELSFIGQSLLANMQDDTNLIFITHHSSTASQDGKGRFIGRYFPNADIVFLPPTLKKSTAINDSLS